MKKFVIASLAFVAFAAPAFAADMPVKAGVKAVDPVVNWTGLYVGINGGYGSGQNCWTDIGPGATPRGFPVPADEGCHTAKGWLGGGQIGYNFQSSVWVYGIEASGDWANITGGNFATLDAFGYDQSKLHSLYSLTGRVGMAWQAALLYAKGGLGVMNQDYALLVGGAGGPVRSSGSENRAGWTVGVGAEYAFTQNISAAIEYDYYGFGRRDVSLFDPVGGLDVIESMSQNFNVVTLRLNYRFGGSL